MDSLLKMVGIVRKVQGLGGFLGVMDRVGNHVRDSLDVGEGPFGFPDVLDLFIGSLLPNLYTEVEGTVTGPFAWVDGEPVVDVLASDNMGACEEHFCQGKNFSRGVLCEPEAPYRFGEFGVRVSRVFLGIVEDGLGDLG